MGDAVTIEVFQSLGIRVVEGSVVASDLGKYLQRGNYRRDMGRCSVTQITLPTNGGPQKMSAISFKDARRLICTSRKPHVIELCKKLNIDVDYTHVVPCETNSLEFIAIAFKNENFKFQYFVQIEEEQFFLDMYFIDRKIAVECDEKQHRYQQDHDASRRKKISEKLGCTFVVYRPQCEHMAVAHAIHDIMVLMGTTK